MATHKRASNAPARTPSGQASDEADFGIGDEELEKLFADALATSSRTVKATSPARPAPAKGRPTPTDEDSIHILIDELDGLDSDFSALLGGRGSKGLPSPDDDDSLPGADDILATLDGLGDLDFTQEGDDGALDFDSLDRELQAALDDDHHPLEDDLQAAMESLLAESYGVSHTGEDFSLPEIPKDDGDEEILGLGDDGAVELPSLRRDPTAGLRAQVAELSRALTMKDIELRTQEDRIETLEQQVVLATRQAANVGREFESARRRAEREREDLKKFAAEKVLKEFLGVFDNLARALQHAGPERSGPLAEGVEMTLGQFGAAMRRCGVEEVASGPNERFDPQWHEAVGQEASATIPPGNIVSRMHAGFSLNGRLLRAAMVTVSRGPAGGAESVAPHYDDAAEEGHAQGEDSAETDEGAMGAEPIAAETVGEDASSNASTSSESSEARGDKGSRRGKKKTPTSASEE